MNCRDYQHQITLLLYEELAEDTRVELETHLRECANCHDAYESEKTMHGVLAEDASHWDTPADLLVESRKALADELDRIEKKRSWWRVPAFSVVFTPMRLLESAALIAMGLALGVYVSNQHQLTARVASNAGAESALSAIPRDGTISNLQVVQADAATGQVELAAEVSRPMRFQGKIDDDMVRSVLFNALRDADNPGSRLKAVEVLSQKPRDESFEEALINALIYDPDAGVRMRALEALKKFADEQHVRAAFMNTLENDENSGIRIEAINALMQHNANDRELAKGLQEATKKDDNPYIRTKVLQFVGNAK